MLVYMKEEAQISLEQKEEKTGYKKIQIYCSRQKTDSGRTHNTLA